MPDHSLEVFGNVAGKPTQPSAADLESYGLTQQN